MPPQIAIIGAGFSGVAAGARLKAAGIDDLVILERAGDVGGTWRDNTYPGIACDTPSHLYSLSFEPNPNWSRTYSPGRQIWAYIREIAERSGLIAQTHFDCEVLDASWEEELRAWQIETSTGQFLADVLIDCSGGLVAPALPDVPGIETFEGEIFHSARWDRGADLAGKRVGVVGTGASAIQIVPAVQPLAESLTLFQRTPSWVVPRLDRAISRAEQRLLAAAPALGRFARGFQFAVRDRLHYPMIRRRRSSRFMVAGASKAMLRLQVRDRALRRRLSPDFEPGCKRMLVSNEYYRALAQANATVAGALAEVRGAIAVDVDGGEHQLDALICATGFHVYDNPMLTKVRGRGGWTLAESWSQGFGIYRATQVAGFPNYFRLCNAGTGLGHGSQLWQLEAQLELMIETLETMERDGIASIDVQPEAQAAYMESILPELDETVWVAGGCKSWYQEADGVPRAMWPRSMREFRAMTRGFRPKDMELTAASAPPPAGEMPAAAPAW